MLSLRRSVLRLAPQIRSVRVLRFRFLKANAHGGEPRDNFFTPTCPEASPRIIFQAASEYNLSVRVIEVPDHPQVDECISDLRGSRVLMLDDAGNIHSIWKPAVLSSEYLSSSYWEFLATLPSLTPTGSIGILGLAGGTVAQMIHAHYPECCMYGWELDPVVVQAARLHMGLTEIEASGMLTCHIGDALREDSVPEGGFAGIMVDLFSDGGLLPALTQVSAWEGIKMRLTPGIGGRVMANLGQSPIGVGGREMHEDASATLQALEAMVNVFGEVSVLHIRNMDGAETMNTVALTGPFKGLQSEWASRVPEKLKAMTMQYSWELYTSDCFRM